MTFQELEQIRTNFNEKRSKTIRTTVKVFLVIYLILFTIASISIVSSSDEAPGTAIVGTFFAFIPVMLHGAIICLIACGISSTVSARKEYIEYKNAYKNYFITSTFQKVFTDLNYSHENQMPYYVLSKTGMMHMGDRYSSNDYTQAKYKGIPFEQADVHIEEESTDSDGDTTYTTIFRGRYIVFSINKKFDKKLLVRGKHFYADKHDKTFKKIKLESEEFNQNFDVYAQDGFEAYYLLDPAVMERIQKLSVLHDGKVMVCYSDGKIHIAINNHVDSFEPASAKKPIDEAAEFNKVMNDIKVVTNIVDELKLVR